MEFIFSGNCQDVGVQVIIQPLEGFVSVTDCLCDSWWMIYSMIYIVHFQILNQPFENCSSLLYFYFARFLFFSSCFPILFSWLRFNSLWSWNAIWCHRSWLTRYMLNFLEGTKTFIHIFSFLHIDMTQVVEILPQVRQELTYVHG